MNKYIKCYNKTEKNSLKKENLKLKIMMLKLKKEMIKHFPIEIKKDIYKANDWDLFKTSLIDLSLYDEHLQNYIINNIINNLNKESIINYYLLFLCNEKTRQHIESVNQIINSFKKTKLIKDITFSEEKKFLL